MGGMPNANDLKYKIALGNQQQGEDPRVKIQLGQDSITIFDKKKVHKLLI